MNKQKRKGNEKKYLKEVRGWVLLEISGVWAVLFTIFFITTEDVDEQEKAKELLRLLGTGSISSLLLYRLSINTGTTKVSADDANDIAEKVMLTGQAEVMDGDIHKIAFEIVLLYPEVERQHMHLYRKDEDYGPSPISVKLDKLRLYYEREVLLAMSFAAKKVCEKHDL